MNLAAKEGLPAYFDPSAAGVFKFVPIQSEMNNYAFCAKGLKAGNWQLAVQGIDVGTFTADELAAGVDLASRPGPWLKLGEDVNRLVVLQGDFVLTSLAFRGLLAAARGASPGFRGCVWSFGQDGLRP